MDQVYLIIGQLLVFAVGCIIILSVDRRSGPVRRWHLWVTACSALLASGLMIYSVSVAGDYSTATLALAVLFVTCERFNREYYARRIEKIEQVKERENDKVRAMQANAFREIRSSFESRKARAIRSEAKSRKAREHDGPLPDNDFAVDMPPVEPPRLPDPKLVGGSFQTAVDQWVIECLGKPELVDRLERCDRLTEEVLELLQSVGYDKQRIYALANQVWAKEPGRPQQELGGVMTTLAAFSTGHTLDMELAGWIELRRCWGAIDQIRAKQHQKRRGDQLLQPEKP